MTRPLTGRAVFLMFAGGFGIIISVNLFLAFSAVSTFPGLEVKNSYVASQSFDADRRAQEALGWNVSARLKDGVLSMHLTGRDGAPVRPAEISAILGRATEAADDIRLAFRPDGSFLVAEAPGASGRWLLRLDMLAEDGTRFRRTLPVVAEQGA